MISGLNVGKVGNSLLKIDLQNIDKVQEPGRTTVEPDIVNLSGLLSERNVQSLALHGWPESVARRLAFALAAILGPGLEMVHCAPQFQDGKARAFKAYRDFCQENRQKALIVEIAGRLSVEAIACLKEGLEEHLRNRGKAILIESSPGVFAEWGDGIVVPAGEGNFDGEGGRLLFLGRREALETPLVFLFRLTGQQLETYPPLDRYRFDTRVPAMVKDVFGCPFLEMAYGAALPDNAIIGIQEPAGDDKQHLAFAFLREGMERGGDCAVFLGVRGALWNEFQALKQGRASNGSDLLVFPKQSTVPEEFLFSLYRLIQSRKNLERIYIADLDLFYFSVQFLTEHLFPLLRSFPVLTLYTLSNLEKYSEAASASDLLIQLDRDRKGAEIHRYLSILKSPSAKSFGKVCPYTIQEGRILETAPRSGSRESGPAASETRVSTAMLEVYYFDRREKQVIEDRMRDYNLEHPERPVRLPREEIRSLQQYYEEIAPFETRSPVPYDLFPLDTCLLPENVERGNLHCLDEYLPADFAQRFVKAAYDSCVYKNRVYALPHLINTGVLIYRKDLLERHGCGVPKTWAQLVKTCQYILEREKAPGLQGFAFQGAPCEALACHFLELYWHNGGDVFSSHGDFRLDEGNREALQTLEFLVDCVHRHRISSPQTVNMMEYETNKLFLDGHAIFMRCWPSLLLSQKVSKGLEDGTLGFSKLPLGPSGVSHIGVIGAHCYVIPATAPDPGRLVKFYFDFFDEQTIERVSTNGWSCSAFESAYRNPGVLKEHPFYEKMPELFATARQRIQISRYSDLSRNLIREVNLALRKEQSPEVALRTVHQKFSMLLGKYGGNSQIQEALNFISENYHLQIDRDAVCQHVGLSQSYFSALFREHTGFSFSEYLLLKRVEAAKSLLAKSNRKVTEVARGCGFLDMSYFSQAFKKVVNMSPSRYRASIHRSNF